VVSSLCMTLLLVTGCSGLTVDITDITMTAKVGIRRDWSWQPCQLMGVATSPRRMYSAGCQDRLFVAWSSHKNWTASTMRTNTFVENTEAHIAEFSINSTTGKTILISDTLLEGFNEVSAVSVTPDCGIVGLIAQSDKGAAEMKPVKDLSDSASLDQSETSPAWTGFMYLLEWTAGAGSGSLSEAADVGDSGSGSEGSGEELDPGSESGFDMASSEPSSDQTANTAAPPSTKILFAKNVKGWDFGDFTMALDKEEKTYIIDSSADVVRELTAPLSIKRGSWTRGQKVGECAPGHTKLENKIIHNLALDGFGRYYYLDTCPEGKEGPNGFANCFSTHFGTIGGDTCPEAVLLSTTQSAQTKPGSSGQSQNQGPTSFLSRGSRGFLALTSEASTDNETNGNVIGLAALPSDHSECGSNGTICKFKYLPKTMLPGQNEANRPGIGFPNIAHIGDKGEEGDRFLLGWAGGVNECISETKEHFLGEVDADGKFYGPILKLKDVEWGNRDNWVTMENGCVVWPFTYFTWGERYSNGYSTNDDSRLSNVIHISVVCPSKEREPCTSNCGDNAISTEPAEVIEMLALPVVTSFKGRCESEPHLKHCSGLKQIPFKGNSVASAIRCHNACCEDPDCDIWQFNGPDQNGQIYKDTCWGGALSEISNPPEEVDGGWAGGTGCISAYTWEAGGKLTRDYSSISNPANTSTNISNGSIGDNGPLAGKSGVDAAAPTTPAPTPFKVQVGQEVNLAGLSIETLNVPAVLLALKKIAKAAADEAGITFDSTSIEINQMKDIPETGGSLFLQRKTAVLLALAEETDGSVDVDYTVDYLGSSEPTDLRSTLDDLASNLDTIAVLDTIPGLCPQLSVICSTTFTCQSCTSSSLVTKAHIVVPSFDDADSSSLGGGWIILIYVLIVCLLLCLIVLAVCWCVRDRAKSDSDEQLPDQSDPTIEDVTEKKRLQPAGQEDELEDEPVHDDAQELEKQLEDVQKLMMEDNEKFEAQLKQIKQDLLDQEAQRLAQEAGSDSTPHGVRQQEGSNSDDSTQEDPINEYRDPVDTHFEEDLRLSSYLQTNSNNP